MSKEVIVSPLPGMFYRRPSPDENPYQSKGNNVVAGDVIGLIEVMKSFYEVKSSVNGIFSGYIVENEDAVQAGQAVAEIES